MKGDGLAKPVRLVGIRADDEFEAIPVRPVILFPVRTPDVAVVDFDQTLAGYPSQVGLHYIGMSVNI